MGDKPKLWYLIVIDLVPEMKGPLRTNTILRVIFTSIVVKQGFVGDTSASDSESENFTDYTTMPGQHPS